MLLALVAIFLTAYFGAGGFAPWGLAVFVSAFLAACILAFTWSARLRCSSCGNRFQKKQVTVHHGMELFLVCERCKRYVYTHSSTGD
jgi:hypothetical protein